MAEFRIPRSPRGCNVVQRDRLPIRDERQPESECSGRGRPRSVNYRPGGLRSRNHSCNSNASETDERYQSDGHMGALRSPLRTDLDRPSRRRDCRGGMQTRSCHIDRKADSLSWKHDRDGTAKKPKRETRETGSRFDQSWRPDSVTDFPPLHDVATSAAGGDNVTPATDWGTIVEEQEKAAEAASRSVWLAPPRRGSAAAPQQMNSPEKVAKTMPPKDEKTPSSPKRRFTNAELRTSEVKAMLVRRQKQIDYGKAMSCYAKYTDDVPREKRVRNVHPTTPDKFTNYSRRGWDMLVKIWKKKLHYWEPSGANDEETSSSVNDDDGSCVASDTTFNELDLEAPELTEENVDDLLLDDDGGKE